jgi:hypothetical protein
VDAATRGIRPLDPGGFMTDRTIGYIVGSISSTSIKLTSL